MLKITGTMMLVLMLTTMTASAAWVPLEVTMTSDESSSHKTYLTAETTINDNGMYDDDPLYKNTYHDDSMTLSEFSLGKTGMMWLSAVGDTERTVFYGFDEKVKIDTIRIWNFNDDSQLSAGIKKANVYYTTETGSLAGREWKPASEDEIAVARGTGAKYYSANTQVDVSSQLLKMSGLEITGLKLEVIETYGSSQAGLSEIQFEGEVVPEPATMGLLAMGGLAMLRSRRRRNNK
jgi:hypothetical protein